MRVAVIGVGNMGQALLGGMLKKGFAAADLYAVEMAPARRSEIQNRLGIASGPALDATISTAQTIVIAVKPADVQLIAHTLSPLLNDQLVVTIAAGIRLNALSSWLDGYQRLVRAMPNTPALIGQGITALYATDPVNTTERNRATELFTAVGETLWCEREEWLDAVTAVSGSGPAYVFYFLEAVEEAARRLGMPTPQARRLTYATFKGSIELALAGSEDAARLRERVTSKGGTTERAMAVMEKHQIKRRLIEAIEAAAARAREIGMESPQ